MKIAINYWWKTALGQDVFVTNPDGHVYQISNEIPAPGDWVYISLEHGPDRAYQCSSFEEGAEYPFNGCFKYGAMPVDRGGSLPDIYGVGKILWTSNPRINKAFC